MERLSDGTSYAEQSTSRRLLPALLALSTAIGSSIAGCSKEEPRVALTHQWHDIGLPKESNTPPEAVTLPEEFPFSDFSGHIRRDPTKTPEWFQEQFQSTGTFTFSYKSGQWDYIVTGYPHKDHKKQKIVLLAVWNDRNKIDIAHRYMYMEKSSDGSLKVEEFPRFNPKTKKRDIGGWSVRFPSQKEMKDMKDVCKENQQEIKVTDDVRANLRDCLNYKIAEFNDAHDNRQVLPSSARDLAKIFFGWEQPEESHLRRVDDPDDR